MKEMNNDWEVQCEVKHVTNLDERIGFMTNRGWEIYAESGIYGAVLKRGERTVCLITKF